MQKNIRFHFSLVALIALVVCCEPLRAQTAKSPPPNPLSTPKRSHRIRARHACTGEQSVLARKRQAIDSAKVRRTSTAPRKSLTLRRRTQRSRGTTGRFSVGTEVPLELFAGARAVPRWQSKS